MAMPSIPSMLPFRKSLSPAQASKEKEAEVALKQCANNAFPPVSFPPADAVSEHDIATYLDSVNCEDLKTLGACLNTFLQSQQYLSIPLKTLNSVRELVCKKLINEEEDAATIGAFMIRLMSCTTNGLCDTDDIKVDALGKDFETMVGRHLGDSGDCLVGKNQETEFIVIVVVCILFFGIIGFMLGKHS